MEIVLWVFICKFMCVVLVYFIVSIMGGRFCICVRGIENNIVGGICIVFIFLCIVSFRFFEVLKVVFSLILVFDFSYYFKKVKVLKIKY